MSSALALIKQTLKHEEHSMYNNLFGKPHTFSDYRATVFRCPRCAARVMPELHPTFKKLCDACPKGKLPGARTFADTAAGAAAAALKKTKRPDFVKRWVVAAGGGGGGR